MRRALLLLTLFATPLSAADIWTRLTTAHFELLTTAGEKRGRELILYFEQVRSFFIQAAPARNSTDFPIRIVVFRNEKQYKPYAPNEVAAAFYAPGRYRDYIVMGDADPEHLPAAVHEFMHLVIHHTGLNMPLWLNEGWADLYSTLKPVPGGKAMVGDLIPGRVQTLQNEKWLSFEALTSVNEKSQTYNEKNRAGIFYAESWALVHMLYFTPEYGSKFGSFVAAVVRGKTAAEACQLVYGRSSALVYADLQAYFRRNRLFGAVFSIKLTKSEEEAETGPVPSVESDTILADLLGVAGKRDQATQAFQKLAAQNPNDPEIFRSMAYLAWQNNDRDGARALFAKAFAAGAQDPEMCYHLAMLELEKNQTSDLAISTLRRALLVKPDYTEARLQLGLVQMNARDYPAALATLAGVRKIDDEHAATLFNALAYAYMETKNFSEARKSAELALKWDRTDFDKQSTEQLFAYLDARENPTPARPPQPPVLSTPAIPTEDSTIVDEAPRLVRIKLERAEGTAQTLDCEGKRFVRQVDGKTLAFDMPDPNKIDLHHEGSVTFEFTCGPQKPFHVVVEYVPADKSGPTRGLLKSLEF